MEIDYGTPAPWVHVGPFGPSQDGEQVCAGFYVKCDRCGCTSSTFMPYLAKHQGWVKWAVETVHNNCLPKAG